MLLWRTVSHVPAAQLAHRVRLRALRSALARWPAAFEQRWQRQAGEALWPRDFTALDLLVAPGQPSPSENALHMFEFLNERRNLGDPADWCPTEASQLWRFHLHYWEWAWPLASHRDRQWARRAFATLWSSWQKGTKFGRWDEWAPYVVSLRAWVLCNLFRPLAEGADLERDVLDSIGLHAGFVAANLELDLGGNHLIKNLKAAIGLGVFLGDDRLTSIGIDRLGGQLSIQVLLDGGHFERSPSYHAQVLGDLLDIDRLLTASGRSADPDLKTAIERMQSWLGTMLLPDRDVPLLNDATLVGSGRIGALTASAIATQRLSVLEPSGYVVLRPDDRLHLVADVGPPCPPSLPGHAHADCLTFELAVDERRIVVDTGTSTYEPGRRRGWERSTAAHNTVEVDGTDQTEVWGTFRAARLAHGVLERATDDGESIVVEASHDGYERLRGKPCHRRTWTARSGTIVINDEVTGRGVHRLRSRLQLAPGLVPELVGDSTIRVGPVQITMRVPVKGVLQIEPASISPGVAFQFGRPVPAAAVELVVRTRLPVSWTTTIELVEDTR